jgi:hypothetical protein
MNYCETCKHWHPHTDGRNNTYGPCDNIVEVGNYSLHDRAYGNLIVRIDFSCILHCPK